MRLTKIYTKTGDKGFSRLASGEKIPKSDLRLEAYGTVDELNAVVGGLADQLTVFSDLIGDEVSSISNALEVVQNNLFDVGGELSFAPGKVFEAVQRIAQADSTKLESQIDNFNLKLKPLKNFILPGGHPLSSSCHLARTVCRRAERRVVDLDSNEQVRPEIVMYLNRLSDWFFVLGRYICHLSGIEEKLWQQEKK